MDLSSVSLAGHAYLDRHSIKTIVQEMIEQLATEMPDDPLASLMKMMDARRNGDGFYILQCDNAWCGMKVTSTDYEEHRKNCRADRWTKCIRCDQRVEICRIHQHRMNCHLVACPQCGEYVLPRMLGLCPLQILQEARQRRGANPAKQLTAVAAKPKKRDPQNSTSQESLQLSLSTEMSSRSMTFPVGKDAAGALKNLQELWRRRHARSTFSALAFQAIWNVMETAREGKISHSRSGAPALPPADGAGGGNDKRRQSFDGSTLKTMPPGLAEKISADYTDAFREDILQIINDRQVVEFPVAAKIITDATKLLAMRPVVMHLQSPTDGKVIIVGDLHGQLKDLLHIISLHGQPSPQKIFVFNGDFVDRGPFGVEILLYIYVLLCAFPEYVHLNRGNHEDYKTNCEYGFQEEINSKYDEDSKELMDAMVRSYKAMPLITVIDKKVAVLHGGLPRHVVSLERIALIGKVKDVPTVEQLDEDDEILCDILWSDPVERYKSRRLGMRHQGEFWRTSARGCGIEYLEGHTEAFLNHNNLEMIVRSHEMVAGGYELCHQGRCATVFSASDYCGVSGNRAAVMVYEPFRDEPVFQTWFIKDDVADKLDFEASVQVADILGDADVSVSFDEDALEQQPQQQQTEFRSRVQDDCIQRLRECLWLKRYELLSNFCAVDTEQVGYVSKVEWCEVARKVLEQPDLPWYYLCQFLSAIVIFREVPSVRYADFVASVDSMSGKLFELDWVKYTIKSVFGGMELPDDLRPASKEHERLARRRHSSMMERASSPQPHSTKTSAGPSPLLGKPLKVESVKDSQTQDAVGRSLVQRGGSTVVSVIAPAPPESPPSKSGSSRARFHASSPERVKKGDEDGGAPFSTNNDNADQAGPPTLESMLSGMTESVGECEATSRQSATFSNSDAPLAKDVPEDPTQFRFNFNYFVSILRAKSAAAAQLEDTDMYILFRYFDQDSDGHVVLGELLELVGENLRTQTDDSKDSHHEGSSDGDDDEVLIATDDEGAFTPHPAAAKGNEGEKTTMSDAPSEDFSIIAASSRGPAEKWMFPAIMRLQRFFLGEQNRNLVRMFRSMDRDRDGYIGESDFHHAFKKMNRIISNPMEEGDMRILFAAIAGGCVALSSTIPLDRMSTKDLFIEPSQFVSYFSICSVSAPAAADNYSDRIAATKSMVALDPMLPVAGLDLLRSSFAVFLSASLHTPMAGAGSPTARVTAAVQESASISGE